MTFRSRPRPKGRARRGWTRRREIGFTVAAILLPLVALVVAEFACRGLGYGGYPPIIANIGDDGRNHWYATHRPGTDTFFDPRVALTGGMRELHFTTPNAPGTVRIAILGGSAAQGFPQPLPLTNGSALETMLRAVWRGERNVEVLNFGATAVASFPVLSILTAVLEHEPDLVVIMAGNNEFYGAYGVSSLHAAGRSPLVMRISRALRGTAIVQWLASLRPPGPLPSGKLMEQVAAEQRIGPDDRARRDAGRSLRTHLAEMVRRCRRREIPVVLCTVPTNERLAPIGEEEGGPRQLSARWNHAQAESLAAADRPDAARVAYVRARDLDRMPWRATSRMREEILYAAEQGAILCDLEAAFRAASPGGVIGWELMDDHVHLTVAGQILFATEILRSMSSLAGHLRVELDRADALPPPEELARLLGRSVYTDFVAAGRIRALFRIPFLRATNPEAAERAERRCRELTASMSETDRRALERWRDPALHGATDRPLGFVVGMYRMHEGDFETAERLFVTARASVPPVSLWRLELVWRILACRRHRFDAPAREDLLLCREAIEVGELLLRFGHAGDPDVLRYLGLAYNLAGDHAAAIRSLEGVIDTMHSADDWEAVAGLVDSYWLSGRRAAALDLLRRLVRKPELADRAHELLGSLEES